MRRNTIFGKLIIGQNVLLKFPAYPYSEFGVVKSKINFISNMPADSGYLARLILPDGLLTNYKKRIQYQSGLTLQTGIVKVKMQLWERFFDSMRKQLAN